jgi:protoporphyrinogen/coproporphyrinogen III oxidase
VTARVAVIGGGVSGLTTAYRLMQAGVEAVVLEAGDRPGGKLASVRVGDLTLPAGADSFLARRPWAVELCRELGLGNDLISPAESGAWLWTDAGLVPYLTGGAFGIPGDIGDVFRWPGLSGKGRRRALLDLLKAKRKGNGDESLGGLLRRRLGDEATDLAIAPLLAGLHAGDVDRLSVRATFPELERWEASQGSLIRGAQAAQRMSRKTDPGPMFVRPRRGVEALTDTLAERLGDRVRTGARVDAIARAGERWRLEVAGGSDVEVDVVVVAAPAEAARAVLTPVAPAAADELAGIASVSTAVVLLVYPEWTNEGLPPGSGFVVPRGKAPMTACTWISAKWPDAAFGTRAVLRCFVGAAGDEDVVDAADEEIVAACGRHLSAVLPLPTEPDHAAVVRWRAAMPQYELGHLERVERIRAALPPGIFVTGQPYDGVGVPDCVRAAGETARAIAAELGSGAPADQETVR